MSDSRADVDRIIKSAFCPAGQVDGNPLLEIVRYLLMPYLGKDLAIARPESKGGEINFSHYRDLEKAFAAGEIHPMDLKSAIASYLNELMEPARGIFES